MNENFLHFIWKLKLFPQNNLLGTNNEVIKIFSAGTENRNAGPDFLNAKLSINNQLWYGNIEIHVRASDWYKHKHSSDENYKAVILHVVWENDEVVKRNNNESLTTLSLKKYIPHTLLTNYRLLYNTKNKWINCENQLPNLKTFNFHFFKEQLVIDRLERKTLFIEQLLRENKEDWEATLFLLLAKNFGLKINAEAFYNVAKSINFNMVRKVSQNPLQMEALLFGQANLLKQELDCDYFNLLKKEYCFLQHKFGLKPLVGKQIQFFRLRPHNFPTIRLSQLAQLYVKEKNLFSKLMNCNNLETYYKIFNCKTSSYWENHFTFGKTAKQGEKRLSKNFVNLLLINAIIPLKFSYLKRKNDFDFDELFNLFQQLKPEKNVIIEKFNDRKFEVENSFDTQALLELKNEYCNQHRCLSCSIGKEVLTN